MAQSLLLQQVSEDQKKRQGAQSFMNNGEENGGHGGGDREWSDIILKLLIMWEIFHDFILRAMKSHRRVLFCFVFW